MEKLLGAYSRLTLVASVAFFMTVAPWEVDLTSGSIDSVSAQARGPGGGGDRGGPGGHGGPGAGAAAASDAIGRAGVSARGNDTAKAATNPNTHGLPKAKDVLDTTPADQNAKDAVSEASSNNDTNTESQNDDFSLSEFGNQMSEDAQAALEAISGLFSNDEE